MAEKVREEAFTRVEAPLYPSPARTQLPRRWRTASLSCKVPCALMGQNIHPKIAMQVIEGDPKFSI